jgi:hypothetical protein
MYFLIGWLFTPVNLLLKREARGLTPIFGMRWLFSRNLYSLFAMILIVFLLFNYFFAFVLWLIAREAEKSYGVVCLGGSAEDQEEWFQFFDVVNLSWMTFTTVGFGSVYPVSPSREQKASLMDKFTAYEISQGVKLCNFLTMVLIIEAFVGVMFTSFSAAVFFGKIMSLQRHASVEFSDICVIRTSEEVIEVDEELEWPTVPIAGSGSGSESNASLSTMVNDGGFNLPPVPPMRGSRLSLINSRPKPNSITAFPVLEFRKLYSPERNAVPSLL